MPCSPLCLLRTMMTLHLRHFFILTQQSSHTMQWPHGSKYTLAGAVQQISQSEADFLLLSTTSSPTVKYLQHLRKSISHDLTSQLSAFSIRFPPCSCVVYVRTSQPITTQGIKNSTTLRRHVHRHDHTKTGVRSPRQPSPLKTRPIVTSRHRSWQSNYSINNWCIIFIQ